MTKETTTKIETLDDDPNVTEARARRQAADAALKKAIAARNAVGPAVAGTAVLRLAVFQADAEVERLDALLADAEKQVRTVERAARERIVAGRQPGRAEHLRRLLAAVERTHAEALAVREYDATTAAALALAPGPHPAPELLVLGETVARLRREIEGSAPEAPAPPPRPGTRRIKLTGGTWWDRDLMQHFPVGAVHDVPERDARDLVERGVAVEVA